MIYCIKYTEITQPNKTYKIYDHMVFGRHYHVILCPKYRRKVLVDGVHTRLKVLIIEEEAEYGYKIMDMEVMPGMFISSWIQILREIS